jgi:hypothetical protein
LYNSYEKTILELMNMQESIWVLFFSIYKSAKTDFSYFLYHAN